MDWSINYREGKAVSRSRATLPTRCLRLHARHPLIGINSINPKEARKLTSEQHDILAHRLPPDSLAAGAEAKSAAAKHPEVPGSVDEQAGGGTQAHMWGAQDLRVCPPGPLTAEAQSAAAKHPEGVAPKKDLNRKELHKVALEDTALIEAEHVSQSPPYIAAARTLSLLACLVGSMLHRREI
ncbi:hypothetical protein NEOLEDRAFT_1184458 [Neolentinus lepideus HHB14362 ss-1]|uniref:Uncharacterized protein n=1 Tax=Neolentinus lepideus HHB14362 ss-1 TaxID=1314782 RepID=A0A165MEC4_9AGAM|nr:hypothetical protein NEOLEDRAFT_1184458 [Neolentinus lepideus HHB14362 ss-1]